MLEVSVIIPIFNLEKYLIKCLDSVVNQSFLSYEVILINDGSQDHSLEICERYAQDDSRFKVITQENRGVSSARNQGLKHAKGKYIVFIDGDDYIESNYLSILYDIMLYKSVDIGICGHTLVYEDTHTKKFYWDRIYVLVKKNC